MFSYIIRRILSLIPMVLIITFLIYLGLELTPGDAVSHLIPPDAMANVSAEQLEALRDSFGLNDPFLVRYFRWLGEMAQGNFGYSVSSGVKISEIVMRNLSATLELSIAALLISTVLGSILGLVSALKKGTMADNILTVAGMVGVSIPQFFFGLVCILLFVLKWKIFPIRLLPHQTSFQDEFKVLILPALVLGITLTAGVMRYASRSDPVSAVVDASARKAQDREAFFADDARRFRLRSLTSREEFLCDRHHQPPPCTSPFPRASQSPTTCRSCCSAASTSSRISIRPWLRLSTSRR